ncbi:MAG: hypothetical protein ACJA2S_003440 [Cyclobacteriaceae bacterium]|jgi:hypothetical protein
MRHLFIILSVLLAVSACNETTNSNPKFVVEGFLFAGEQVEDFRVKEQTGIDEADSIQRLITNASVVLEKEGKQYALQYDEGYYKYFGNDLAVESGDQFRLEVTVGDRTATAETTVPNPTKGLTLSDDQMIISEVRLSFSLLNELTELFFSVRLTAEWDNSSEQFHFIVIEPASNTLDPIYPEGFPQEGKDFLSGFKFAPEATEVDTFSIIGLAFDDYGRHRVKVYRVNQEYADLFNNPQQDSRDLTRPPSNIINGFGIFSAFAADSVFFEIRRE